MRTLNYYNYCNFHGNEHHFGYKPICPLCRVDEKTFLVKMWRTCYPWNREGVNHLWEQIQRCFIFFRAPKSPLLLITSRHAKFNPCSTWNRIGGRETGNTRSSDCRSCIHDSNTNSTGIRPQFRGPARWQGKSNKLKMAAIDRKCLCNNVYLRSVV